MGKIYYKKMSLFEAPKGSSLVHACNEQGVWGSGIAAEFKKRFPKSFEEYRDFCNDQKTYEFHKVFPFPTLICKTENDYKVGCLMTSSNYGSKVDSEEKILRKTQFALEGLIQIDTPALFYSNKFNSGLFKVPWEKTEALIQKFIDKYDIDWVVCDPNLEEK